MSHPIVGCDAAKEAMVAALREKMEFYGYDTLKSLGVHYAAARDIKRGTMPAMSMEKMITSLRLMGYRVSLLIDDVELPKGS